MSLNERAGASWPPSLGQPATRSADGGLGAAVFAGSQVGSQRQQTSGDTQPQLAAIAAAKQPVRPQPAPSRDGQSVPSKQRVAGSNPARRAGQRHITILSLNDGSPTGSQRERDGRRSGTSSARGTEAGLPRCQRQVTSVITARLPADMVGDPGSRVAFVAGSECVVMRALRPPTRSSGACPLGHDSGQLTPSPRQGNNPYAQLRQPRVSAPC